MNPTEAVSLKLQALYGERWGQESGALSIVSDALQVNRRTLQSIHAAHVAGTECEYAGGVLRAIGDMLDAVSEI